MSAEQMRLHGEIMNIECKGPALPFTAAEQRAYKLGHRDARHAAAELALATQPQAPQGAVTGEPVAWMTEDGRVSTSQTKAVMGRPSRENFNIPLYRVAAPKTPEVRE